MEIYNSVPAGMACPFKLTVKNSFAFRNVQGLLSGDAVYSIRFGEPFGVDLPGRNKVSPLIVVDAPKADGLAEYKSRGAIGLGSIESSVDTADSILAAVPLVLAAERFCM